MLFFTGVALINAAVMHSLAPLAEAGDAQARLLFAVFDQLLVGYGWLGNPLFLVGLTLLTYLEVGHRTVELPCCSGFGRPLVASAPSAPRPGSLLWGGSIPTDPLEIDLPFS